MQIELNNLVRIYDSADGLSKVAAVNGISLTIPSNQIFGIIGKSGAGKSSLVRLISMMEKPDSGEVLYDGKRVDNLDEKELVMRRRRIGMIFQNFNLFSSRSAGQNIAYPMEICGVPKDEIDRRVDELLEIVELSDRKNARISTLSGGQKQRIAIARALANKPDVLFCDEATSALDPQTTTSILNLIRKIQSQMNLTVVMITHQMEVVRDACSQVAVINEGKLVEVGSVNDIFLNPKSPVTKDFISHIGSDRKPESDSSDIVRWSKEGGEYELSFPSEKQGAPVLSTVAKKFDIEFNIRAAGVQHLTEGDIGKMIVDFTGFQISEALEYLRSQNIIVEKAGV
ncbi:MAG: methionine ABC transporter ATP-binding protein [Treponema sp.]|nr:methionine ABC transporter ATP-binding protein [Treponema sp.]MDY3721743.1 methionine ABC transporter ATP-binding protein [Treponema sp.]MDY5758532.1 methionine ABC transporter ATP-binding protein [Treponema sp.]